MRAPSICVTSLIALLSTAASSVWSQMPDSVQRSSSPQGFQVQGAGGSASASAAVSSNTGTVAAGKDVAASGANTAVATGRSSVQVQGTTRINAAATNTNVSAVGQGNKAGNELGAIGGK